MEASYSNTQIIQYIGLIIARHKHDLVQLEKQGHGHEGLAGQHRVEQPKVPVPMSLQVQTKTSLNYIPYNNKYLLYYMCYICVRIYI